MRIRARRNRHYNRYYGLRSDAWREILIVLVLVAVMCSIAMQARAEGLRDSLPLSPVPNAMLLPADPAPVIEDATSEQHQIVAYIKEVFGPDSDKAFTLLSCENARLNPNAVNTAGNVPAGSRDIGVFQINEFHQKVQGRFLFNWKVNVEIAHEIFVANGHSFERWTCGRKFGI